MARHVKCRVRRVKFMARHVKCMERHTKYIASRVRYMYGATCKMYCAPCEIYGAPCEIYGAPCEMYGAPCEVYGVPWNISRTTCVCCTHSDNFRHLARLDRAIPVDVIHLEGPFQLLFRLSGRGYIDSQEEFFEVYFAAIVRVERPEDMFAELLRVPLREETGINFEELGPSELTVRTVLLQDNRNLFPLLVHGVDWC